MFDFGRGYPAEVSCRSSLRPVAIRPPVEFNTQLKNTPMRVEGVVSYTPSATPTQPAPMRSKGPGIPASPMPYGDAGRVAGSVSGIRPMSPLPARCMRSPQRERPAEAVSRAISCRTPQATQEVPASVKYCERNTKGTGQSVQYGALSPMQLRAVQASQIAGHQVRTVAPRPVETKPMRSETPQPVRVQPSAEVRPSGRSAVMGPHTPSSSTQMPRVASDVARAAAPLALSSSKSNEVDPPTSEGTDASSDSGSSGDIVSFTPNSTGNTTAGPLVPGSISRSSLRAQSPGRLSPGRRIQWLHTADPRGTPRGDKKQHTLREEFSVEDFEQLTPTEELRKLAWHSMRLEGSPALEDVTPQERAALESLVKLPLQGCTGMSFKRVQNPILSKAYRGIATVAKAREQELVLFHGTKQSVVQSILANGLDPATGSLSPGVWLGPTCAGAHRYASRHGGPAAIFVVLACPSINSGDSERSRDVWRMGTKDGALPAYVVMYRSEGDGEVVRTIGKGLHRRATQSLNETKKQTKCSNGHLATSTRPQCATRSNHAGVPGEA
mmetsp:Transcript_38109/g.99732  ORF Transcript_38109/g.99732 Transcript_38109/m.99732 type:complete len:554 (+) Transcript_38109:57-1718(+)